MKEKKILICDDDHGILEMLEMVLEEDGYQVVVEAKSINALNRIAEESPDLILLDIWMPVITGDQILSQLRADHTKSNIPVLMYSASTDGKLIAEKYGANGFIAKPFDLEDLLHKVSGLLI
ncbi:Response regulator receiver domain-containing protein [Pedobacter westerhofensis]|uniref:Response regulator receiver domain-containing protein n=1 Tax=Pedobacter westerhofensis TaxID=425512 RepID=A0A521FNE3_9SPHI|nr:response regulator [Pedobacter westerhofensis]SMO96971.1 Response regulator receiver domain-containing protein [Pedobacter westerhofensis]